MSFSHFLRTTLHRRCVCGHFTNFTQPKRALSLPDATEKPGMPCGCCSSIMGQEHMYLVCGRVDDDGPGLYCCGEPTQCWEQGVHDDSNITCHKGCDLSGEQCRTFTTDGVDGNADTAITYCQDCFFKRRAAFVRKARKHLLAKAKASTPPPTKRARVVSPGSGASAGSAIAAAAPSVG
ncbi:unnamed protein product [Ectocarpus sp. CCAP 1310/34]|nr:unnamed protein product [Ectocarpus sp. CCAP 1310/34]